MMISWPDYESQRLLQDLIFSHTIYLSHEGEHLLSPSPSKGGQAEVPLVATGANDSKVVHNKVFDFFRDVVPKTNVGFEEIYE